MDLERRELKYRITPEQVAPIRAALERYCEPDRDARDGGYLLSSLYFDTPRLRCYREYRDRQPNRFKLRVRRYEGPTHFIEQKARFGDVFRKIRVRLPEGTWPDAFRDPRLLPDHRGFQLFVNRILGRGLRPTVLTRYRREAWSSRVDEYARVTFDHQLEAALPDDETVPVADGPRWRPMDHTGRFGIGRPGLILELKCLRHVPLWMMDLLQRFGLQRQGFSKYAAAIETVRRLPAAPATRVPVPRLRRTPSKIYKRDTIP